MPAQLRALVVLGILIACGILAFGVVHVLGDTASAWMIIGASAIVLYVMLPLVRLFERWMSPTLAFAAAFVVFTLTLVLLAWWLLPPLVLQAQQFAASLPQIIDQAQRDLADPNNRLLATMPPGLRLYLTTLPQQLEKLGQRYAFTIAQHAFSVLTSAFAVFLGIVIVPILTAYLFFDHRELKRATLGFVPASWRPRAVAILRDMNDVLGSFVRGQLIDGAILGVMIYVLLLVMHVPFALLIGALAGILNFIPYVGAVIGFIPSVLLALAYHGWQSAVIVGIGFAVIQQIDGNLIEPRIMKAQVQLSPVVLIVSILIFSELFGVVGTFIAVPVSAMLRVLKLHFAPAPTETELQQDEKLALGMTRF
ncbi:MAG: AI-2E family transporter [Candidatus Eremiobacteraeota bacterium]|nr:AI-2E family transporter [Candidatus Eremiobacteraeota bacterium]